MTVSYLNKVARDPYFRNLLLLRDRISSSCDNYFHSKGGVKIDLYLITNSISSPIGLGSDSKPLPIRFGRKSAMLADSSQFGMEVLTVKQFKLVYCYLPSFRGEKPDSEHLNQFFHCEAEMRGSMEDAISLAEGLVRRLLKDALIFTKGNSSFHSKNLNLSHHIEAVLDTKKIMEISFDEAAELLFKQKNRKDLVKCGRYGRRITRDGEKILTLLLTGGKLPIWLKYFDRDMVPFYQKPLSKNTDRAVNADLIFPSINGGYGGEIIGAGQRQDNIREIRESISRQGIKSSKNYNWYINLRRVPQYRCTSGFGLGIERLLAWVLCASSIHDVIVFPRALNKSLEP